MSKDYWSKKEGEVHILPFTGGVDSLHMKQRLKEKGIEPKLIYFDFDSPYNEQEKKVVKKEGAETFRIPTLDGVGYESYHIPARNLLIISNCVAWARNKNYEKIHIWFPQIGEIGCDKNNLFFFLLGRIFKSCYDYDVEIHRPLKYKNKWEIINEETLKGYSCYEGEEEGCGNCSACGVIEEAKRIKEGMESQRGFIELPHKKEETGKWVDQIRWHYIFDLPQIIIVGLKKLYTWVRLWLMSCFTD